MQKDTTILDIIGYQVLPEAVEILESDMAIKEKRKELEKIHFSSMSHPSVLFRQFKSSPQLEQRLWAIKEARKYALEPQDTRELSQLYYAKQQELGREPNAGEIHYATAEYFKQKEERIKQQEEKARQWSNEQATKQKSFNEQAQSELSQIYYSWYMQEEREPTEEENQQILNDYLSRLKDNKTDEDTINLMLQYQRRSEELGRDITEEEKLQIEDDYFKQKVERKKQPPDENK
jgi:hypothetical protein